MSASCIVMEADASCMSCLKEKVVYRRSEGGFQTFATGQWLPSMPQITSVFIFHRSFSRHLFPKDHSRVTSVTLHKPSHLLVVGFASGVFSLYEMPDFNLIHSLRYRGLVYLITMCVPGVVQHCVISPSVPLMCALQ